jgi:hypothetical protein
VDVGGYPGDKSVRFKFNMPGCGCEYNFKGLLDTPFELSDGNLVKTDIENFMRLFMFGDLVSVNYCQQCGSKLPRRKNK